MTLNPARGLGGVALTERGAGGGAVEQQLEHAARAHADREIEPHRGAVPRRELADRQAIGELEQVPPLVNHAVSFSGGSLLGAGAPTMLSLSAFATAASSASRLTASARGSALK